jgi:hypothetical protein
MALSPHSSLDFIINTVGVDPYSTKYIDFNCTTKETRIYAWSMHCVGVGCRSGRICTRSRRLGEVTYTVLVLGQVRCDHNIATKLSARESTLGSVGASNIGVLDKDLARTWHCDRKAWI